MENEQIVCHDLFANSIGVDLFQREIFQLLHRRSYREMEEAYTQKRFPYRRCLYAFTGILLVTFHLLLTFEQLRLMSTDDSEFAFSLLLVVYSSLAFLSVLSTAVFCRITNAVLTTLIITLLAVFTAVHFYIRYRFFSNELQGVFSLLVIRLGFGSILFIIMIPWTHLLVHRHRMSNEQTNEFRHPRITTFLWLLYLDCILIISLFTLNIGSRDDLDRNQILFLIIEFLLVILWLMIGMMMVNKHTYHWLISTLFYILSLMEILHLIHMTYSTLVAIGPVAKIPPSSLFSLLIITFVCLGATILIHLLTILISLPLFDRQIKE